MPQWMKHLYKCVLGLGWSIDGAGMIYNPKFDKHYFVMKKDIPAMTNWIRGENEHNEMIEMIPIQEFFDRMQS